MQHPNPMPKLRKQDWTADILTPTQVFAKLDAQVQGLKAVVVVSSKEELEELCTVITAHGDASVTAVAFEAWSWTKTGIEQAEPAKAVIQVLLGTATVTRDVRLHKLGKDCPAIKQVARKATGDQKPATTVVLRFAADARYLNADQWAALTTKPAASIRAWAAADAPSNVLSIKDMWGFRVLGDPTSPKAILSGLVRVQASKTQTWLALSGRDRWFIESPGERAKVSWVKRQKDETLQGLP